MGMKQWVPTALLLHYVTFHTAVNINRTCDAAKLSTCSLPAIYLALLHQVRPSIKETEAREVWYKANKIHLSLWDGDSLPTFLFSQDSQHETICSPIFLFLATITFNADGANPRHLAKLILLSVETFSSIIFNLSCSF